MGFSYLQGISHLRAPFSKEASYYFITEVFYYFIKYLIGLRTFSAPLTSFASKTWLWDETERSKRLLTSL